MTGANWHAILGAIVTVISVPASETVDGFLNERHSQRQ